LSEGFGTVREGARPAAHAAGHAVPPSPHHLHHPNDGVLTLVKALLEILVIALFVVTFLVQPYRIPSGSMEPTLLVGDFVMVDKEAFGPGGWPDRVLAPQAVHRGDLVVFHYPPDPTRTLVKRVIGLPGDHLRLRHGRVFIDGTALDEPYAFHSSSMPDGFRDDFPSLRSAAPDADPLWWVELRRILHDGEIVVPDGHYFVMGDNRDNSEDSRYWGFVAREEIIGRPRLVYFTTHMPVAAASMTFAERMRETRKQMRILR
jgi:signal peptidase I